MVFAIKFDSPDEAAEEEYALRDGWGSEINTAVSGDTVYVKGGDLAKKVVNDWYPSNKTELVDPPEDIAKMLHGADEADEANADKSYVLAHKGPNDTTYCKNKAGDWTTHIEDAWEGSGPDSFSAEMKRNFADAVHCDVKDLEVIAVKKFESFEFDTPHFKPREYEGEYILYTLYGLDSDGDELEDIITSPKKSTVVHTIKALLPDYRRIYNGMHVVAILYDENHNMLDSVVVWSTDQNEANGADGFSHTWELQAQQAKETLEEITRKFGDADRLAFEIRNFPHTQECDVVVTVDGDPFITAEFEGGKHSGIRWHCFEDDTTDVRLDVGEEDAARNMILAFKDDILDALESLYGFGAIADEDGQRAEKTAWTYLVELETLEGAESRQEATEKILKALGYNPGTEGRWYNKDGEEIGIIDTLDNTEWAFAVKTCGQLQESTEKQETSTNPRWCVEFCDIYSNVEKEYYNTEADAKARYDELAEREDIEWVKTPTIETVSKEEKLSYDDYAESVKSILMGREFEYGPETANVFVVDDYKDIVRKNFDAGKNPFTAASDIDDAYMGKE